ncbi:MAG: sigma 54-interacting transcriptional regulator [Desulfobacteraceae bacterium]|jgi:PAS domain S-box-containing protein
MNTKIDYRDIFHFTSNGVIVTNAQGVITHINRRSKKHLQIDARMHVGQPIADVLPMTGKLVRQCLETGRTIWGHQASDKNAKIVLNVTPILKDRKIIGAICAFQELSIFEASAKNLEPYRQLSLQLETIFNASSDGLWVCNGQGVVIAVNRASEILNGIKAREVIGRSVDDLLAGKVFDQSVTRMVLDSGCRQTVMQRIGKTGKFLLSTGTPVKDDNGEIFLVVINERDMTELNMLRRQIEHNREITEKYKEKLADLSLLELRRNEIIADSSKMRHILQMSLKLSRIAASNILILGESGTGKGLLAKLIHKNSTRNKNPFVEINCAALPENLLEAELFGYEKGAFTGASDKGKIGLFELAQGGTLLLDEIGDMPLPLQAKLLKYLDDHEIRRIGGTRSIKVECSTIAATNQDLSALVKERRFREDLYYRLNSFILSIPPLRERPEDVAGLVRFYLNKYNRKYKCTKKINSNVIHLLEKHAFPGNVRELKNIIENAVVMSDQDLIDNFIQTGLKASGTLPAVETVNHLEANLHLADRLGRLERQLLLQARQRCRTTREMAAVLGISQPSVVRKLHAHGL